MLSHIINFGGNIRFTPRHHYAPASENEVLEILDRHAQGKIRAVGALHSWNGGVVSDDVLVDLRHLDSVDVQHGADGAVWATVGGGCRIKQLLRKLHRRADATMPSLGLITAQTIGGAISTATHGSGKCSLSHYVDELRVAAYDAATGKARIYTWSNGPELNAARCALGCMGIILSVRIRCVPRYDVAETMVHCATLDDVLARESEFPLQQFYLVPYLWSYFVQRRHVTLQFQPQRRRTAKLFRAWWFVAIDVGLHLIIKLLLALPSSPFWVRFFFRRVLAKFILTNTTVVDHGERMLVMKHELFKHLEIEIFVPDKHLRAAAALVRDILEVFDGTGGPDRQAGRRETASMLESVAMYEELLQRRGTFTHHYAITFRRVQPDDALISMTGGAAEPYYSISFITYMEPRDSFLVLASFLCGSMTRLFDARLHWGKYFPTGPDIATSYPRLPEFRACCRRVDPNGVFRNAFVERVLFGDG